MMNYKPQIISLKNGENAILRVPEKEDAAKLLDCFRAIAGETEFLLSSPEDIQFSVQDEEKFIEGSLQNENRLFLICEINGKIVGDCEIHRLTDVKNRHRAEIGIGLRKEIWNQGIGTAMFRELIAQGKKWGLSQIELDFVEGNARARALYEKMGFRIVGCIPNAIRQRDGRLMHEYKMIRDMEEEK